MGFTADVLLTLLAAGFFALCWVYVRGCDRIIGPDDEAMAPSADASTDTAAAEPDGRLAR